MAVGPRKSGTIALTHAQVKLLLARVTDLRDHALLLLAIDTGMRREDIVSVKLQDVDLKHRRIRFWEAKKRRVWEAWIGEETTRVLATLIHERSTASQWLFPSPWDRKGHLSSRAAYNILQRWLKEAGLKTPTPFHALRATHIKLAQGAGRSIEVVMRQTGDSFRTIKEHYDTPSDEEMAQTSREKSIL